MSVPIKSILSTMLFKINLYTFEKYITRAENLGKYICTMSITITSSYIHHYTY